MKKNKEKKLKSNPYMSKNHELLKIEKYNYSCQLSSDPK